MIKRIRPRTTPVTARSWLNLEAVEVEFTSEHPEYPIEEALLLDRTKGWRAAFPGPQSITLIWSDPILVRRVRLVFEEHSRARTQEFLLRASTREGVRDIVRQQFTFSPPGTTVEREEYRASIDDVTRLELAINPAIDQADAVATLREWRLE
jgi:hypothetical protein